MDAKLLLLIALLAPVLMLAAGFARRENAGDNIGNGHPEDHPGKTAHSASQRLMRVSESYGVAREDFLKNYQGSELDPRWLNRVSKLSAKGWKNLVARDKDRIKEIRGNIHALG